jgi:hypothetical protein
MQEDSQLTCYNEPITIYRHAPLDLPILERAFAKLIERHEAWRTVFSEIGGIPVQLVQTPAPVQLPLSDIRYLPQQKREAEALRLASEDAGIPFDLAKGPLFRARVVRLDQDKYRIFVTAHHIILDGVTVFNIAFRELAAIYEAFVAGEVPSLPYLPVQYADFAHWQCEQLPHEAIAVDLAHWRSQFECHPGLRLSSSRLPTDRPRPHEQTFRGAIEPFSLPMLLTDELRRFSQRHGMTLFGTLLAALAVLLYRYTRQHYIMVGTVTPGERKREELRHVMGLLQNRVALPIDLTGDPDYGELLHRVRNVLIEALCHDSTPFEMIADDYNDRHGRQRRGNPLFDTMFSLEPALPSVAPGWDFTTMDAEPGGARLDLYIEMDDRPNGMLGRAQYNTDLFNAATIRRLVHDFQDTLQNLIAAPDQKISELPLLPLIDNS